MDGFDSLCCLLGGGAGNFHGRTCAPKKPPALASLGPPARLSCIPKSHMWDRRYFEPAPHLAAPSSPVLVKHYCIAAGWGTRPEGVLWSHSASEESASAAAHLLRDHGCTCTFYKTLTDWLPTARHSDRCMKADALKWGFIHKAFRRAWLTARHFIYMFYCYWNLKDIHISWFPLFN